MPFLSPDILFFLKICPRLLFIIEQILCLFSQNQIQIGGVVAAVELRHFELIRGQINAPDFPRLPLRDELDYCPARVTSKVVCFRVEPDAKNFTDTLKKIRNF